MRNIDDIDNYLDEHLYSQTLYGREEQAEFEEERRRKQEEYEMWLEDMEEEEEEE